MANNSVQPNLSLNAPTGSKSYAIGASDFTVVNSAGATVPTRKIIIWAAGTVVITTVDGGTDTIVASGVMSIDIQATVIKGSGNGSTGGLNITLLF